MIEATDWEQNILTDDEKIADLLRDTKRVAVLGIKTELQANQPSYYVPQFLIKIGLEIFPVPVYFPEVEIILDRPVYRRLVDIHEQIDIVDLFRRAEDLPDHLDDILAARPRAVWMQKGIRNKVVAEQLAHAGIAVVQDRCLMTEYRRLKHIF